MFKSLHLLFFIVLGFILPVEHAKLFLLSALIIRWGIIPFEDRLNGKYVAVVGSPEKINRSKEIIRIETKINLVARLVIDILMPVAIIWCISTSSMVLSQKYSVSFIVSVIGLALLMKNRYWTFDPVVQSKVVRVEEDGISGDDWVLVSLNGENSYVYVYNKYESIKAGEMIEVISV